MTKYKYSKSSSFYFDYKKNFFQENEHEYSKAIQINKLYSSQPKRKYCKLCSEPLKTNIFDFKSHNVEYQFCVSCNHLNGMHDETNEFFSSMYIEDDGVSYSVTYIDNNYQSRVNDVYMPKLNFMLDHLNNSKDLKYLDIGCGAGHLVSAGISKNLNIEGIDVGAKMVKFGNSQIELIHNKTNMLKSVDSFDFYSVMNDNYDVISLIGVMEHLQDLEIFFDAFKSSKAQYLFFSVPMFSPSVVFENVFENVFPRQLSSGHTHLFTEESLKVLFEKLNVKSIVEWRFGTDIMDLLRSCLTQASIKNSSTKFNNSITTKISPIVDKLQNTLDEHHFCSEIHCLAKKI